MKHFLIHPTHRKYIKLLRTRSDNGNPIITTKKDWDDFLELVRTTKQRLPRHKGLYRITLRAMNRSLKEINSDEIHAILDGKTIDIIEGVLAKAERKSLGATLKGAYLIPILRKVIKRIDYKVQK